MISFGDCIATNSHFITGFFLFCSTWSLSCLLSFVLLLSVSWIIFKQWESNLVLLLTRSHTCFLWSQIRSLQLCWCFSITSSFRSWWIRLVNSVTLNWFQTSTFLILRNTGVSFSWSQLFFQLQVWLRLKLSSQLLSTNREVCWKFNKSSLRI